MVATSPCEYCYCIKGRQHCVRPHCLLEVPGCKPEYSKHSCCPVKYHCSDSKSESKAETTTAASSTQPSGSWCKVNGTSYPEGEKLEGVGTECENCYCMKGRVRCEPIICALPVDACTPVTAPGHCCPSSYNCSSVDVGTTVPNLKEEGETTEYSSPTTLKSETESSTLMETTEGTTLDSGTNVTELRSGTEGVTAEGVTTLNPGSAEHTTLSVEPTTLLAEHTTLPVEPSTLLESNSSSPVRAIPDVLEAILNRTLAKEEEYDYDYNEPSLPPSLPNLKIIPFVAADAVVNEQDEYRSRLEGKTEIPIYLDIPQPNRFSPPSKTEGGFVPRDPVIDGPFYESKFEKPFNQNEAQVEFTSETLLPPITEPPKLFEEGKCDSEGRMYHHGEVVSEPNACELCVCYYRQIHCQKPKCNPIKSGCKRVHDGDSGCCGREICGSTAESPTRITNNFEMSSLSTLLPESMSNIPAVTVADLVVTPNPFKDVIRTEPAPDLEDIMKDMLPHIMTESSPIKPATPNFTLPNKNGIKERGNETVLQNGYRNQTKHAQKLGELNSTNVLNKTNEYLQLTLNGTKGENSSKYEDDYEDSFSLSSVLDLLFKGASPTSNPKPNSPTTTQLPFKGYNIHHTNQKQDINNAIENVEAPYVGHKDKLTEKPNDLSIFNDYQADESRNDTKEEEESSEKVAPNKADPKLNHNSTGSSGNKTIKDDIASGLLKLAGCNIYGRMYRVGRIISELSSPCLECMCTEFGVQCRKLC